MTTIQKRKRDLVNPMIPFMTGWLWNVIDHQGRMVMTIKEIKPQALNGVLEITFESGLRVMLSITELPPVPNPKLE